MIAVATLALSLLASADQIASAAPVASFDRAELAGWADLAPAEVVPFHREGMQSQLLFGARSPGGSYAFVTIIDNGLGRPAEDAGEVASYISEEAYAHFQPEGYQKGFVTVSAGDLALRAAAFSFAMRKLPYALGTGGTAPALFKAVFLPVVLRGPAGGYQNLIFVANFRGTGGDLAAFERMSRRFRLEDDLVALVSAEVFNARPSLPPQDQVVEVERVSRPAASSRISDEERVDRLGTAVGRLIRREESPEELQVAEVYARQDGTTPLARSILELQRRERIQFETRVWQRLLQEDGAGDLVRRLASHLLAESIVLGDLEIARAVTRDAEKAGLSAADLGCTDLEPLVDALLRRAESPSFQEPGVQRFFALAPAWHCQNLRAVLESRGWVAKDLVQVARAHRAGGWELRQGITDLPRWVWHEGRLASTVAKGTSASRVFALAPVAHLLSIVEPAGGPAWR